MSIYCKHVISQGETLQEIAHYELGDMSKWTDIKDINDLEYPYIVETPEEKLKNINHLLCVGDFIYLPKTQKVQNKEDLEDFSIDDYDKKEIYDLVVGRDIYIRPDLDCLLDDSAGIIVADNHKDIKLTNGVYNVFQSIILRIMTKQGSLYLHPNYGSTFTDFIGKPINNTNRILMENELERTITTDKRVRSANVTSNSLHGDTLIFDIEVKLEHENVLLSFYISVMNNGYVQIGLYND